MATTIRVTDGTNRHSPGRQDSCLKIHEPGGATLKSGDSVPRFNLPFCKAFGDKRYQFCIPLSQPYFRTPHRFSKPLEWSQRKHYGRTASITRRDDNQKTGIIPVQFMLSRESRYSDLPTLSYTSACESTTHQCTWSLKYPFVGEPPHFGHDREYPRVRDFRDCGYFRFGDENTEKWFLMTLLKCLRNFEIEVNVSERKFPKYLRYHSLPFSIVTWIDIITLQ